jgi:tetratricopeptide (TPR) repeat protein
MNSKALCMRVVLASALMATAGLAGAQSRNEQSAQDAAYACPLPQTAAATLQKMGELYPQKHDKNKLGCAADLMHAAATAAPDDVGMGMQALLVAAEYIDHVNTLWDYDIYGVRVPEWTLRLSHAIAQGRVHDAQLARLAPDEPSVLAARSLFDVSAAYKMGDASAQLGAARLAIQRLEAATAKEPGVLDGNGLYLLGRLLYELPEYSGGDVDKGLQVLDRAHELAPANPSFARYYAQALDLERRRDEARAVLATLLALEPAPPDWQLAADELRNARDLAARMQAAELEQQLTARRDALLQAHPQLLTRASSAANLHGGVDPITGKPY